MRQHVATCVSMHGISGKMRALRKHDSMYRIYGPFDKKQTTDTNTANNDNNDNDDNDNNDDTNNHDRNHMFLDSGPDPRRPRGPA